ncbi:hypothetical protein CLOSTHATH_02051 [Hungatella hathewayi DSM 13479]|uniref:Uncharacterized protein n=1 Tax=Hungatella hathewayi DSM 13479 TaxID=566550 RepID=D3AEL7_9FIRM|nr:hypothetical protein CLOSTHATH_02051 [Hungatella hathewayi DSM 13479]
MSVFIIGKKMGVKKDRWDNLQNYSTAFCAQINRHKLKNSRASFNYFSSLFVHTFD